MSITDQIQKTNKIEVELLLTGGTTFRVNLFVRDLERVNDLLNDPRSFLPFEDVTGQIRLVNKAMILTVIPTDSENVVRRQSSPDPFADPAPGAS